jgi:tRNA (guanine-N7-)-methyltransferase
MRKKPNLLPRLERCAGVLVKEPAGYQGRWAESFSANGAELWLELGCGKGRFTAQTAQESPEAIIIAVEKVPEALVVAMERVCGGDIPNVRFVDGDALALPVLFAENEVKRIFINFCDPWKKNRDAKHRLTAPGFLSIYESVLAPGGELHFKTDNDSLFEYSLECFKNGGWIVSELTRDLHENGPVGVMTDYELKFHSQGVKINRLVAAPPVAAPERTCP